MDDTLENEILGIGFGKSGEIMKCSEHFTIWA